MILKKKTNKNIEIFIISVIFYFIACLMVNGTNLSEIKNLLSRL